MFDIVLIWWGEILSWSLMGVKELDKHSVVNKISTGKGRLDGFKLTGQKDKFEIEGTEK